MQMTIDQATTIVDTRVFGCPRRAAAEEKASGLYYHLIFKANTNLDALGADARRKLFGFVFGCSQNLHGTIETVGGRGASLHLLISLDSSQTPADFIKKIKLFSSVWARRKLGLTDFRWLDEEASTVSQSERPRVAAFIQSQSFLF